MATLIDLDIRPRIKDALKKASFEYPADLLKLPSSDLQKRLRLSENDASELFKVVAHSVYPLQQRASSALALLQRSGQFLTTGDEGIDQVLGGGLLTRGITEIVGESASGKTQLLLQLCLTVQLPLSQGGLDGAAVYLHSEGKFPIIRLRQLTTSFQQRHEALRITNPFSRIHFVNLADAETQHHVISYHLPALLARVSGDRHPIRLVIVDSIAALYRGEHLDQDAGSQREQKRKLCELSERLKTMSEQFEVPIVCANQVSDTFGGGKDGSGEKEDHPFAKWLDMNVNGGAGPSTAIFVESLSKKPALGLMWSNAVNMRIRLARSPRSERSPSRRLLCIEFAPHLPCAGCEIYVDVDGVHSQLRVNDKKIDVNPEEEE